MSKIFRKRILQIFLLIVLPILLTGIAAAQSAPSAILQQFQAVRNQWFSAVSGAAQKLFMGLALIEFAWSAALLLLEKTDLQGFTAGVVRRLMFIGGFYTLLQFGPTWIPAIIDSFELIGQKASGAGALAPSAVFGRGLDIAGNLFQAASQAGFFENMGTAMALVFAAILGFLAFVGITIQFIVAMVESYIVVGAGFIFLGFGGSRWTASYVERYIALAVAVGVKILVLYMLIAGGMQISTGWADVAAAVANQQDPAMSAWDIAGGALIFLVLCWQAPKLISGILGGSPTLTGGDLVSTTGAIAVGGFALAGTAAAGVAWASRAIAAKGAAMSVGEAVGANAGGKGGPSSPASGGGSNVGHATSHSGSGLSSSGSEGASTGSSRPPSAQLSDLSGGLQESGRVSPPVVAASQDTDVPNPEAAVSSRAVSPDPGAESGRSRIGTATARAGSFMAKVSGWTGARLHRASATTGKARYVIPNDTPPPAPPPPPVHSQEPD